MIDTLADAGEETAMARTIRRAGQTSPRSGDLAPAAAGPADDAWPPALSTPSLTTTEI